MSKVYYHLPMAPDELLGHVEPNGKVYETRFGPDQYIGRVDLSNGKIYAAKPGPDNLIGHVNLVEGDIYETKIGPDKYVGKVIENGHFYKHKDFAADEYLGKITPLTSYAMAGAAFLLLILPYHTEEMNTENEANDE